MYIYILGKFDKYKYNCKYNCIYRDLCINNFVIFQIKFSHFYNFQCVFNWEDVTDNNKISNS